jgi:soluble P-type ATPase
MFELEIPGFGPVKLGYLVSDYTGTLSVDGRLLPGIRERLDQIATFMEIHILTADTFGKVREELQGMPCRITILTGPDHHVQKEDYINRLGPEQVIAFGNGTNDRRMLKAARVGVAVSEAEGCAVEALKAADVHVRSAQDGLNLLLNPKRLKATLRY